MLIQQQEPRVYTEVDIVMEHNMRAQKQGCAVVSPNLVPGNGGAASVFTVK